MPVRFRIPAFCASLRRGRDRHIASALLWLVVFAEPAIAQSFAARAEQGERLMMTAVGDAYLEAIAPALQQAAQQCAQADMPLRIGESTTLVAWVSSQGAWSSVEVEPVSAASSCLSEGLQSAPLPAPAGWDWARGAFALTLRVGAGRGRVDGVSVGD